MAETWRGFMPSLCNDIPWCLDAHFGPQLSGLGRFVALSCNAECVDDTSSTGDELVSEKRRTLFVACAKDFQRSFLGSSKSGTDPHEVYRFGMM